jgi:hypothetical protein
MSLEDAERALIRPSLARHVRYIRVDDKLEHRLIRLGHRQVRLGRELDGK